MSSLVNIFKILYVFSLIAGTTYLVGWCGWSKWTYVFMMILANIELKNLIHIRINNKR